ncbi:MAG: hypothetical protein JO261_00520, partial [Alphaproteobacteria bacterium]|nr:hypothetical protein [Alphaproteobacteria bacterium]
YGGDGSPAYGGGGVYTAPPCNYYRFDAVTGVRDWYIRSRGCHGGGGLAPIYLDGNIFIQDVVLPTTLSIRDAATGKNKGTLHQYWGISPALYTDNTGADRALTIYGDALDTMSSWLVSSRERVWTYKLGNGATFITAPIVINGLVFVGLGGAQIAVLDANTGALLNTITVSLSCSPSCFAAPELTAGDGALMVDEGTQLQAYVPQ